MQKYRQQNTVHVLKSLVYFDDVDVADWPVLLSEPDLSWNRVQNTMEQAVKNEI